VPPALTRPAMIFRPAGAKFDLLRQSLRRLPKGGSAFQAWHDSFPLIPSWKSWVAGAWGRCTGRRYRAGPPAPLKLLVGEGLYVPPRPAQRAHWSTCATAEPPVSGAFSMNAPAASAAEVVTRRAVTRPPKASPATGAPGIRVSHGRWKPSHREKHLNHVGSDCQSLLASELLSE